LGADLVLETRREWTPEAEEFIRGLGAVEEARDGAHGLQEGRHAEVVE
jgi:hypothetical protein